MFYKLFETVTTPGGGNWVARINRGKKGILQGVQKANELEREGQKRCIYK